MPSIAKAAIFTFTGAAFIITGAILRVFQIVEQPVGYTLLGIGVVLGIIGGVLRRRIVNNDK